MFISGVMYCGAITITWHNITTLQHYTASHHTRYKQRSNMPRYQVSNSLSDCDGLWYQLCRKLWLFCQRSAWSSQSRQYLQVLPSCPGSSGGFSVIPTTIGAPACKYDWEYYYLYSELTFSSGLKQTNKAGPLSFYEFPVSLFLCSCSSYNPLLSSLYSSSNNLWIKIFKWIFIHKKNVCHIVQIKVQNKIIVFLNFEL